ncbi:MAG: YbaN family protein [Rubrimonas sp.]|uniref:YbaN family protein n=1 Tax=Rubrimonas sp. TaxID=2036015 RepID=UPI002FDD2F0F
MRAVWFTLGWASVGLGVVGIALPLLPTVPFLLLASFCFARSSQRVHDWLLSHPRFGPPIADWRANGAIRRPVKRLAMLSILASFAIPLALGAAAWVLAVQAGALAAVAVFILTRPEGP